MKFRVCISIINIFYCMKIFKIVIKIIFLSIIENKNNYLIKITLFNYKFIIILLAALNIYIILFTLYVIDK